MNVTETVIFGHKQGEPDYTEILLLTHAEEYSEAQLDKVKAMMTADGWIIRTAVIDLATPPDFSKTIV